MTRRCSHCSNNGHNSRTCPTRSSAPGGGAAGGGVRLFGVRLTDGSIMKKSASMGNLSAHYHSSSSSAAASPNPGSPSSDPVHVADGYLSDDPAHASSDRRGERKKGVPWTEEEHRLFLVGLQKLGKGDWRGIARNFVVSRTPTQVASHAQKYFIRQSNATRRKRRSSLFDMAPDVGTEPPPVPEEQILLPPPPPHTKESDNINTDYSLPSLNLSLNSEFQPMDATSQEPEENPGEASGFQQVGTGFFPGYLPVPYPIWMPNAAPPPDNEKGTEISHHQVLKPIPIHSKEPVNVDELVGMSQLSIGDAKNGPTLSLKLLGESSRQSAFHTSAPASGSGLSNGKSKSMIQTV